MEMSSHLQRSNSSTDNCATYIQFAEIIKIFIGPRGNKFRALDDINIQIQKNEFFTLLGPSGCGKTTLLRLLAGFGDPTSGRIVLDGEDLVGRLPNKRPVNTVFQSYALFPHMTVAKNVTFGLEMLGWDKLAIKERQDEVLELVRLEKFAGRKPSQLSGGQQQRVALARALAPKPKVLLLDEPLSALDRKLRKEMQVEMTRISKGSDTTFLFVTHDQEEALIMSDRIAVMNAGRIDQIGTPSEIYYRPTNRFVADFIGEMNFLKAIADGGSQRATLKNSEMTIQFGSGETLDKNEACTLAIRPEFCRVSSDTKSDENRICGTVRQRVFSGTHTTLILDLSNGATITCWLDEEQSQADSYQSGSTVDIFLPASNLRVVKS